MTSHVTILLLVAISGSGLTSTAAQDAGKVTLTYTCSDIGGSMLRAPKWQPETDRYSGQSVNIWYRGDGEAAAISWRKGDEVYYETAGMGLALKAGFVVLVLGPDRAETYAFNPATMELLFTDIRSGSALLPNSVKAFRGTCSPGK